MDHFSAILFRRQHASPEVERGDRDEVGEAGENDFGRPE
jgi:hypothetical protein